MNILAHFDKLIADKVKVQNDAMEKAGQLRLEACEHDAVVHQTGQDLIALRAAYALYLRESEKHGGKLPWPEGGVQTASEKAQAT